MSEQNTRAPSPAPLATGGGVTREELGECVYLALYGSLGGSWQAVETREIWFKIGDAILARLAASHAGDRERRLETALKQALGEYEHRASMQVTLSDPPWVFAARIALQPAYAAPSPAAGAKD